MNAHGLLQIGFPLWLRITHLFNFLLITLLMRSGIQILADHPMLYFNDHCTPGTEWIRFTRRKPIPKDRLWTSMDEASEVSSWIALPGGRHNLGVGRHWHFISVYFWLINGFTYIVLLFTTGNWVRLIPTSWQIFPDAWHTFLIYSTFHIPPASEFRPYDPLQQLSYAGVVFILAPLSILTGIALSPAFAGHFPMYLRLLGGRQKARSLHFIVMTAFLVFLFFHIGFVVLVRFKENINHIVLGTNSQQHTIASVITAVISILIIFMIHAFGTWFSWRYPRRVQHLSGRLTGGLSKLLLSNLKSRQEYQKKDISPYFWINGKPPITSEWRQLQQKEFSDWRMEVHGLVQFPLRLALADLYTMQQKSQITEHCCIQGWSSYAEWTGVPLSEILRRCQPLSNARYLMFYSYQIDENGNIYYESLSKEEAIKPQTILAYRMNGQPLPVNHGAPLRLRVETKLGFKMVKWIKSIELVEDYHHIGEGQGGYREDCQYYGTGAEI